MIGIRFYEEFVHKRKGKSAGTVVAVLIDTRRVDRFDGIGGVFDQPNSHVASTSVSTDYLRQKCKRTSEHRAREIHPNLFERLDE